MSQAKPIWNYLTPGMRNEELKERFKRARSVNCGVGDEEYVKYEELTTLKSGPTTSAPNHKAFSLRH